MTVNKLIKLLEKMPGKAKVSIDVSYEKPARDWIYEAVDLKPRLVPQVETIDELVMTGVPRYNDMCVLGTIVGNYLE